MKRSHQVDLTTGSLPKHFRTLAIPAALGMIFNTLYNMVDMYFAGLLSTTAQAGLAIGFMTFFIYIAFGFGLSAGISALIGGAIGKREVEPARRIAGQGLSFAVILSCLLMGAGLFLNEWLVNLVSEPGPYRFSAVRYLLLLLLAIPGFIIAYTCNGILQAQGDALSLTRALFVAFFANVALNPLLIFGIPGVWTGVGFDGLALSTILSQTGVMLFMLLKVFSSDIGTNLDRTHLVPRPTEFLTLLNQMLPSSFSLQIMIIAGFSVQYALKSFGDFAIAAYGVGMRIEQLLLLPILGLASSLLPIVAQNFGANNFGRIRVAVFFAVKVTWLFMAIACPILWFSAATIMQLFTDDADVIREGVTYLRFDIFLLPVYGMLFIVNAFLQALKRPIWVLWISVYRQGFGVAFFVWLYLSFWSSDIMSVWFGVGTSVLTGLLLSLVVAVQIAKREIHGLWNHEAIRT